MSVPQVISGENGILAECIASALRVPVPQVIRGDVDGDNFPLVVCLNEVADVPLVNLFSEAGLLLTGS